MNPQPQIISRQRTRDHGEVFTAEREVKAMLDLVKAETERIESRFLEPACGNGNFLAEVLKRKLGTVVNRYAKSQAEYGFYAVLAVSSIYGIDILEDNAGSCRERLFGVFNDFYRETYKTDTPAECAASVRYILGKNIVWGDALDLKRVDGSGEAIVFCEWSPLAAFNVQRRDFRFDSLTFGDLPLFSDNGEKVMFPTPVKDDYPPSHYLEVMNNG